MVKTSGLAGRGRHQAVAQHDLLHPRRVGCSGHELGCDLPEVGGPELAGREDAEAGRGLTAAVGEPVDHAAADEDGSTEDEVDVLAVDPPGRGAGKAVDRLVPALVMVRHRHPRVRLQGHLEHVDAAAGLLPALQEAELQGTHADGLAPRPRLLPPLPQGDRRA